MKEVFSSEDYKAQSISLSGYEITISGDLESIVHNSQKGHCSAWLGILLAFQITSRKETSYYHCLCLHEA